MIKTQDLKTWNILVIDDDSLICEVSRLILERKGCKVWLAGDGAQAMDLYVRQQNSIELAIVDYDLPDISGLELCDQLRDMNPDLKLIGISGFISPFNNEDTLVHSSLDGILMKPFMSEQLYETVHRVMGRDI